MVAESADAIGWRFRGNEKSATPVEGVDSLPLPEQRLVTVDAGGMAAERRGKVRAEVSGIQLSGLGATDDGE